MKLQAVGTLLLGLEPALYELFEEGFGGLPVVAIAQGYAEQAKRKFRLNAG